MKKATAYTLRADFRSRLRPVVPETHRSDSRGYLCALARCMRKAYPHGEFRLFNAKGREETMYTPTPDRGDLTEEGRRELDCYAVRVDPQTAPLSRATYPLPPASPTVKSALPADYKFLPLFNERGSPAKAQGEAEP